MSKSRKSKILATMMCAAVMAGLHAAPVMAGTVSGLNDGTSTAITAEDTVIINGVTLAGNGITAANGKFKVYEDGGLRIGPGGAGNAYFTINGSTGLVSAKSFEADHVTAGSISAGNKNFGVDQWGNVYIGKDAGDFSSGSGVNAVIKLSTDGTISAKNIAVESVVEAQYFKIAKNVDGNTTNMFLVDNNGAVRAANGAFGVSADGTVSVGGDETNGKIILDAATGNANIAGELKVGNDINVVGAITAANGSFVVEEGSGKTVVAGGLIYSENQNGSYGMLNGNQLTLQGDGNKFSVVNGNVETTGTMSAANGLVAGTEGEGTFKVKNIGGNTMAYMVDKDGNYTVGINAQNGNIETKGALAVTNAEGNNVFTANSDGMSVGGGNFAVDAATGNTKIAGGLNVGTNIEVAGGITASSLTLDGLGDVETAINELQTTVGAMDSAGLPEKVGGIERVDDFGFNTTTIEGVVSVSEAKNGTPGKFSILNYELDTFGEEVFSVNDRGYIDAKAVNPAGETKSTFKLNDEEATLLYGENGITANAAGTTISGAGTDLKLDANGATFTNASGTTVINGSSITTGAITADSLTLDGVGDVKTVIDDLKDFVGDTGTGSETLAERVQGLEANTQNIVYQDAVTHINGAVSFQNGYQVTFKHGNDVISLGDLVDDIADLDNRLDVVEDKTQNINGSEPGTGEGGSTVPPTTDGHTGIEGDVIVGGDLTADGGNFSDSVTVGTDGNKTIIDGGTITTGDTTINGDGITVGAGVTEGEDGKYTGSQVTVGSDDVKVEWTDEDGSKHDTSIRDNYEAIENLGNTVTSEVNRLDNRISQVEDRIDKVGAMSAAIANLRTMGYDPAAPTEIAVGLGQYRSETGAALGLFHYPNRDFMLSLSVSTSGDEVMGGIGATWKFGRKTPDEMLAAEKEKAAAKKLAKARKAEAMKKAAAEAEQAKKVAAQQAKHAKMAAEKAAK